MSIDPSCGSSSSMPGYALSYFDMSTGRGEVTENGIIEIPNVNSPLHQRLHSLQECLQSEFGDDLRYLITEDIAPKVFGRGRGAGGHASLLKAVGVTIAACEWRDVFYVHPQSWHLYTLVKYDGAYIKSDENDARVLSELVLDTLAENWRIWRQ